MNERKTDELTETELDAVAGGATTNRYNPAECSKHNDVHYNCVGFLSGNWCDHYRRTIDNSSEWETKIYRRCVMGFFDVTETQAKDPGLT
ncbi:MAG: hypothetical protein FWG72_03720 [Oscillospiraceae bacterium]|nr:hypothetical protein [Oscillospiraceae bacterium]